MIMKAISQPNLLARIGIVNGAANAPTEEPALNKEVAKARSFFGKYSAVVLMAAGKLPASPNANTARQAKNNHTLTLATAKAAVEPVSSAFKASIDSISSIIIVAQPQPACIHAPSDHTPIAQRKPFLVPIQSTKRPANRPTAA